MEMQPKPFVWQMIKEAVEVQGNKSTNIAVRDWVLAHYPGTNVNSILNQIIVCTVNHVSRTHYRENQCQRRCSDVYDFLYRTAPGKLEMYDPRLHGVWEIAQDQYGALIVREVKEVKEQRSTGSQIGTACIEAKHLRAYLAKNLDLIEEGLELYVDIFGNDGVEYQTEFGPVDILAVDKQNAFVIINIKLDHYPDASSGQILKYRNWVRRHLAFGKAVRSYLIGPDIPEHVRYSLADCDDVFLKKYDLTIRLKDVPKIADIVHPPSDTVVPQNKPRELKELTQA